MILFYGYSTDDPLARAVEEAAELGVEYVFVDQLQESYHDVVLELGSEGLSAELSAAGRRLSLDEVTAVYARPLASPPHPDPVARERGQAANEALLEWMDAAECLVVSRPSAMHSNASKPFQAQAIASAGLDVPETLVTSDPDEARAFRERHGEVVYKSTSGIRSIVRRLEPKDEERWDRLRDLPVQFQELVEGSDVRVHVVGDRTFATEIKSGATDYRYARRDGLEAVLEPVDLPSELERRCIELAVRLELPFAGIDLRRRGDGTYVCFEVNPMPGYSYYERETGQPISSALVQLLAGGV